MAQLAGVDLNALPPCDGLNCDGYCSLLSGKVSGAHSRKGTAHAIADAKLSLNKLQASRYAALAEEAKALSESILASTATKGKNREGEKKRRRVVPAPDELESGFTLEGIRQIVVGRYKTAPGEYHAIVKGPYVDRLPSDRKWNKGIAKQSRAWVSEGPLYLFLSQREEGWMPINASDPIIFNNMTSLMHTFVLEHLES